MQRNLQRNPGVVAGAIIVVLIAGSTTFLLRRSRQRAIAPPATQQKTATSVAVFPGKIQARHTVAVSASVNGEIGSFLVDAGQDVYEGQLLARIVNPGLETAREIALKAVENAQAKVNSLESAIIAARLEASRAGADATRAKDQYERSEKVYRRQTMLNGEGATPRQIYEKAKREFESQQADFQGLEVIAKQAEERVANLTRELQAAKRALEDKNQQLEEMQSNLTAADVHAPVTGIVVARRGEAGKMLGPEDASELFRIAVDNSQLQAVFEPDAATLHRIKPGQPAFVTIPDVQSEAIPAAVKEVRGSEVVAELVSPNANIRPGMNCSVSLPLK